jgi:hypothetical protein
MRFTVFDLKNSERQRSPPLRAKSTGRSLIQGRLGDSRHLLRNSVFAHLGVEWPNRLPGHRLNFIGGRHLQSLRPPECDYEQATCDNCGQCDKKRFHSMFPVLGRYPYINANRQHVTPVTSCLIRLTTRISGRGPRNSGTTSNFESASAGGDTPHRGVCIPLNLSCTMIAKLLLIPLACAPTKNAP